MTEFELSPAEDTRFDHLMDVHLKNADEAREIILKERNTTIGGRVVAEMISVREQSKVRRPNTRGGRSYPEKSDSELDPFWNGEIDAVPVEDEQASKEGLAQVAKAAEEAAVDFLVESEGFSKTEAIARRMARKEINHR